MNYIISGIQQVGIGIPSVERAWAWYRKYFGMRVPVFQEAAEAGGDGSSSTRVAGGGQIWAIRPRESDRGRLGDGSSTA